MNIFEEKESSVRSYCRRFPAVFDRAKGSFIYSQHGEEYIDFLAGAGALNYGHNNPYIKEKLITYLNEDKITHGLDLHTSAKAKFIEMFDERILRKRKLSYRMQFCGPTGTNAVEAALKIARKTTRRRGVFSFMGAFHGMTLGALALTGNKYHRHESYLSSETTFMPFPYGFMNSFDTIGYMESVLSDPNSGIDIPAAIIVETIQAEGGVIIAPTDWLRRLRKLCDEFGIFLIVDDIQVGCYRSGRFFSFERAEITPDIVVLSKSIGGYGLPISLLLITDTLDKNWQPGEHNGTFRGNQLAFVAAVAALEYAQEISLEDVVVDSGQFISDFIDQNILVLNPKFKKRGMGMIWGIDCSAFHESFCSDIVKHCFNNGLIIEPAGRNDCVIKLMPPLNTPRSTLQRGLTLLSQAFMDTLRSLQPMTEMLEAENA